MKLHLLHQLFGQWQDLVFGTKHMVDSDTAGDLMKILILVKRLLRRYGYPPDMQLLATETVLKQAEKIAEEIINND